MGYLVGILAVFVFQIRGLLFGYGSHYDGNSWGLFYYGQCQPFDGNLLETCGVLIRILTVFVSNLSFVFYGL